MTHERGTSDWGDWLTDRIAAADPDGVAVWYLGCNGLAIKAADGTTLFCDPYLGLGDPPRLVRMCPVPFDPTAVERADAVLATHEHVDHVHGPTVAPILENTDASLVGPTAAIDRSRREGWATAADRTTVAPGESHAVGPFTIHVEGAHDPDAETPVSYVIEHPSGSLVHSGDGRPDESYTEIGERYDLDVGVVAVGSSGFLETTEGPRYTRWYNDPNQAIELAAQLRVDRLVPTHFDIWRGLTADPTALDEHVRSFERPRQLTVLEIGDRITV
ncbi:MAG: MBL fold metallo-hydrolase [Halococcoides sp.]